MDESKMDIKNTFDYPLQESKPLNKTLYIEWENYFNDAFDVYSINNGIDDNGRPNYDAAQYCNVEFYIDDGRLLTFENEDIGLVSKNNSNIAITHNIEIPKELNSSDLNNQKDKASIQTKIVEKNENYNGITGKDQEISSNLMNHKEKIEIRVETDKNNTNLDINTEDIDLNQQNNLNEIEHVTVQVESQSSPKSILKNEVNEVFENKYLLKNKDKEIKNLNEKLNNQKYQNKIILDENKKLLEIINIFKILQNIEKEGKIEAGNAENSNKLENGPNTEFTESINEIPNLIKMNEGNQNFDISINQNEVSDILTGNINNIEDNPIEPINPKKMHNTVTSNSRLNNKISQSKTYINTNKVKKTSYGALYKGKSQTSMLNNKDIKSENLELQSSINKKQFIKINEYPKFSLNENSEIKHSFNKALNKNVTGNNKIYISKLNINEVEKVDDVDIKRNNNSLKVDNEVLIEKPNTYLSNNEVNIPSVTNVQPGNYNPFYFYSNENAENEFFIFNNENYNSDYTGIIEVNSQNFQNNDSTYNNKFHNSSYDQIIKTLAKYREMNDRLISSLNVDTLTIKIDIDKRKKDVEQLGKILDEMKFNDEPTVQQKHVIPFYLIDKRELYENIVNYIYTRKERIVPYQITKNESTLTKKSSRKSIKK